MLEVNPKNPYEVIETNVQPRYSIKRHNDGDYKWELDDLHEHIKVKIISNKFKDFDNIGDGLELDCASFNDDLEKVKEYLKDNEPTKEYEVYGLSVYQHSGCAFHLVSSPVHDWDTSTIGFVALPKDEAAGMYNDPVKVGHLMTDIHEGNIYDLQVEDAIDGEVDDGFTYYLSLTPNEELEKWVEEMNKKYQMKEDADKILWK